MRRIAEQLRLQSEAVDQQHAVEDVFLLQVGIGAPVTLHPVRLRGIREQRRGGVDGPACIFGRPLALRLQLPCAIEILRGTQVEHRAEQRPLGAGHIVDRKVRRGRTAVTLLRPVGKGRRQRAMPAPRLRRRDGAAEIRIDQGPRQLDARPEQQHAERGEEAGVEAHQASTQWRDRHACRPRCLGEVGWSARRADGSRPANASWRHHACMRRSSSVAGIGRPSQ